MSISLRGNPNQSKDISLNPYLVRCDQNNCKYLVSAPDVKEGQAKLALHKCPHYGGPTTLGHSVTVTILEKAWLKLDVALVELIEGNYDDLEKSRLKGVCRGMAEVIAEFMVPHFRSADEISAEARRRYKAKKAGEPYETVGLSYLRLAPPPGDDKYTNKKPAAPRVAAKPASRFTETEVKAIKAATDTGMMTVDELCRMYRVSKDVIEQAIAS